MKKLLILVSALALVFTSCSNDDDDTSSNTSSPVLLTKTVETYDDGSTLTTNFSYSGNKLIGWTDSDGESTTFSYDSNGRLTSFVESYYDSNDDLVSDNASVIYDSNGRITSFVFDDGTHFDYTYNSDGTIDEDSYSLTNNIPTLSDSYKYAFSNGNIVTELGFGNASGKSVTSTFDSKNSPIKNMFDYPVAFYIFFGFDANNNLLSYDFNDTSNSYQYNIVYSYTYNSNDYPITSSEDNSEEGVISTQYFYNQ